MGETRHLIYARLRLAHLEEEDVELGVPCHIPRAACPAAGGSGGRAFWAVRSPSPDVDWLPRTPPQEESRPPRASTSSRSLRSPLRKSGRSPGRSSPPRTSSRSPRKKVE